MMTYDELVALLLERGATGDCPSCGQYDWLGADDFVLLPSMDRTGNRNPLGTGYRAVLLACGNCGLMKMHSVGTLEANVDADPDDPEGSEAS
jgi:hypothetical protein